MDYLSRGHRAGIKLENRTPVRHDTAITYSRWLKCVPHSKHPTGFIPLLFITKAAQFSTSGLTECILSLLFKPTNHNTLQPWKQNDFCHEFPPLCRAHTLRCTSPQFWARRPSQSAPCTNHLKVKVTRWHPHAGTEGSRTHSYNPFATRH
jgi:hypothetical protein